MKDETLKLINDLNKKMGNVIYPASQMPEIFRIRTYIPGIDWCSTGGTPVNRVTEYYGHESSGKTYVALINAREFQNTDWNTRTQRAIKAVTKYKEKKVTTTDKQGDTVEHTFYVPEKYELADGFTGKPRLKNVYMVDVEGTYDAEWAEQLGIDNNRITRIVPKTGEQAVDIAEALLRDPETCLVIFDSVGATRAAGEIEKSMEDQTMGLQARFWNRAAAKFQSALNSNPEPDATLILINRAYSKIGLVFGDPEQIGGGTGIRFAKSMSLKFHAKKEVKGEIDGVECVTGRNVTVQNRKNKTGKPHRESEYFFVLCDDPDTGLKLGETDVPNDLTEIGVKMGLIERSGTTYSFGRYKVRGRDNWVDTLRKNKNLLNSLLDKFYTLC